MGRFSNGKFRRASKIASCQAGQNFFVIYGAVAAALIVMGTAAWEKILGVFCVLEVLALLASRGITGVAYPLALAVLALLVVVAQTFSANKRA